jgi:hypothetical protein
MGRLLGRLPPRAALVLLLAASASGLAARVFAQDGEEIILDPELGSDTSGEGSGASDDEVIADPELGDTQAPAEDFGWGPVLQPSAPDRAPVEEDDEEEYDPLANTGLAKLELLGQVGVDLRQEGDLEDAYETRLRFGGEIEFRRSRHLRLVIGSRIDFFWAVPSAHDNTLEPNEGALDQDRYEVDLIPTAAYADMTVADGLHLRVGQQMVSLGRMDFYSPTDALVLFDMRPQPKLDPAAAKMAQPAVRMDWDITTSLTLQAAYVPWFSPHLTRPNRDRYVANVLAGRGSADVPPQLSEIVDPSFQTKASESNIRYVGPAPDFSTPQGQARLAYRGYSFDFGITAASALEKLPAAYMAPALERYLLDPNQQDALAQALIRLQPVFDVEFHRYHLIGGDLGFSVGPVAIAFEGAFSPERHLYAATSNGRRLAQPNVSEEIYDSTYDAQGGVDRPSNVRDRKIRKGVPVVQGAVHIEWVRGESLLLGGEAFWVNALELPYDRSRDWWGFIPGTGTFAGGSATMRYMINEGQWRFEATLIGLVGPSMIMVPRIELRAREGLFVDVGAQLYEGPAPGYGPNNLAGAQNLNLGGLLSGYDQAFVGLRWLP